VRGPDIIVKAAVHLEDVCFMSLSTSHTRMNRG
jgi:hypothetical protein